MSTFLSRLLDERAALEEKIGKLNDFLASDKVEDIDDAQKALLHIQAAAMSTYWQCLEQRIIRLSMP